MSKDKRHLQILIVEDNIGDFVLVEDFLFEEFENLTLAHVKTFKEGKEALQSDDHDFDLILLDLSLPDISGEEVVDRIIHCAADIPVVILTGFTDLTFSRTALAKGASDYLLKDELTPSLLYKSIIYSIERNAFSSRLKESEKKYRDLFELSPEPMFLFDVDNYEILNVNQAAVDNYGYTKEEFLSMTLMDIKPSNEIESAKKIIQQTREALNITLEGEHHHIKKNGDVIIVEIHASDLKYNKRNARMALARNVTEKRIEEQRLKLLESVITNSTEMVAILEPVASTDQGRSIIYVNEGFTKMTGYTADEVLGKTMQILNGPKTNKKEIERLDEAKKNWEFCQVEFINYRKDGSEFWVNTLMIPVADNQGGYSHWVVIGRDISARKKYENDLKKSLDEKEILLSEIHHRVKNNLAVVSAMMQLQIIEEKNEVVIDRLQDSVFRIQTMATIHELLYESGNFSQLHFSEIIKKLANSIHDTLHDNKEITVHFDITPVELNINQAIPCSLIVNEVITNVYKHAFKGKKSGSITINVHVEDGGVSIRIHDDGVGLPEGFDADVSGFLGTNLIRTLSSQLEADFNLMSNKNGTTFTLEFKKTNVKGMGNALM